jgi:hypothetical protein
MKDESGNEGGRILDLLTGLIFLAYLLVLIKITLIKNTTLPLIFQNLMTGTGLLRSMNLIPFKTISDYLQYRDTMSFPPLACEHIRQHAHLRPPWTQPSDPFPENENICGSHSHYCSLKHFPGSPAIRFRHGKYRHRRPAAEHRRRQRWLRYFRDHGAGSSTAGSRPFPDSRNVRSVRGRRLLRSLSGI